MPRNKGLVLCSKSSFELASFLSLIGELPPLVSSASFVLSRNSSLGSKKCLPGSSRYLDKSKFVPNQKLHYFNNNLNHSPAVVDSDVPTFRFFPKYGKSFKSVIARNINVNCIAFFEMRLIIKKKQGKANVRNRMRRRVKEAFRLASREIWIREKINTRRFLLVQNYDCRIDYKSKKGIVCLQKIEDIYKCRHICETRTGVVLMVNNAVLTLPFEDICKDARSVLERIAGITGS